jgi:hypothetical protein
MLDVLPRRATATTAMTEAPASPVAAFARLDLNDRGSDAHMCGWYASGVTIVSEDLDAPTTEKCEPKRASLPARAKIAGRVARLHVVLVAGRDDDRRSCEELLALLHRQAVWDHGRDRRSECGAQL